VHLPNLPLFFFFLMEDTTQFFHRVFRLRSLSVARPNGQASPPIQTKAKTKFNVPDPLSSVAAFFKSDRYE
jgi:hypothetical protein